MPLKVSDRAPNFSLRSLSGEEVSLDSLKGYRLLVFYKVTCPTCQLTLPFIQKLFKSYGHAVSFLGISQDGEKDTERFARDYGLTFPQLIDYPDYPASLSYDVQVVPTLYLVDEEGRIAFLLESFVKSSLEELNEKLADLAGSEVNPLFEDVSVPPFKAG